MTSLTHFDVAQTTSKIIEVSGFIHNTLIFIYHSYRILKRKQHRISYHEWLSIALIFLYILFGLSSTLASFSLQPRFISCKIFTDIMASQYFLSKTMLYSLFLERLFSVFHGTRYSFQRHSIYISRISLILYIIGLICIACITGKGYYASKYDSCYENYPMWIHGIAAFGDCVIGICTSILFIRRLMLFQISTHKSNSIVTAMMEDVELLKALNKFTLLTFISVFTTLFSLVLSGIFELAALWVSIDAVVNCWCVVLTFKVHNKLYINICGKFESVMICNGCLPYYSCNCCCKIKPLSSESIKSKTVSKEQSQHSPDQPRIVSIGSSMDELDVVGDKLPNIVTKIEPQSSIAGIPVEYNEETGSVQIIR